MIELSRGTQLGIFSESFLENDLIEKCFAECMRYMRREISYDVLIDRVMEVFVEKMEPSIRKEIEELSAKIAEEHYNITDGVDQNLHYLWYMYHKGTKAGTFRPFVYMAELQLLKKMGYVNDTEIKNMIQMLESEDKDNLHMVTLSIKNFRDLRLQEHGEYSKVNEAYWKVAKNYAHEILNHEIFMQTMAAK